MITVRDLVERLGLPVLAGYGGLEKPVRWVHISELLDPTQWLALRGRDLLARDGAAVGDGRANGPGISAELRAVEEREIDR